MSFHMHLRAAEESAVQGRDFAWLLDFMGAAWDWDVHQAEYAAGLATSVEKDFGTVHDLCQAGADLPAGAGGAWDLPVYGGHVVHDPSDGQPPFALLTAAETRTAAAFLTDVPFEALWESAGPKIHASLGPGREEGEARGIYAGHHTDLRAFYGRAAGAGQAVVKAFWY
ncbi:hypothetical protein QFZ82_003278 [Streptomyces sp. V4I23]|uniref:DUF1877 family protein n=1 Tax=Streptomyces sp. V4I23 TaxID=3042282 RepID=UPI00278ACD1E|nr:DUF1877 family protein [Streptomyces sp. V4I23]MDQ1008793.1 hypothetical protein [Streptomyces sp. V4I23]